VFGHFGVGIDIDDPHHDFLAPNQTSVDTGKKLSLLDIVLTVKVFFREHLGQFL
jgi:hypothetical protein